MGIPENEQLIMERKTQSSFVFCLFKVIVYFLPWKITMFHHHLENILYFCPTTLSKSGFFVFRCLFLFGLGECVVRTISELLFLTSSNPCWQTPEMSLKFPMTGLNGTCNMLLLTFAGVFGEMSFFFNNNVDGRDPKANHLGCKKKAS